MSFMWTSCRRWQHQQQQHRQQQLLKSFLSQLKTNWPTSMTTMKPLTAATAAVSARGSTAWHIINFCKQERVTTLPCPSYPPKYTRIYHIYGQNVTFYFVANTICFLPKSFYSSIYFTSCRWSHRISTHTDTTCLSVSLSFSLSLCPSLSLLKTS